MEHEFRGGELPKERDKELIANFQRAHAELRKRADIGTFLISEDAVQALRVLENELAAASAVLSWHEHLTLESEAVGRCLKAMREIAKKDLQMK